jgi:hypothetical protein
MEKHATRARKTTIIIHCAKVVIVIQRVLSLNSLVVDPCQRENFVNVKREFKEEFAINADHCTGISMLVILMVAKNVNVSRTER